MAQQRCFRGCRPGALHAAKPAAQQMQQQLQLLLMPQICSVMQHVLHNSMMLCSNLQVPFAVESSAGRHEAGGYQEGHQRGPRGHTIRLSHTGWGKASSSKQT